MKLLITILIALIAGEGIGQKASPDGYVHIYYVTDERGNEVGKRVGGDSSWVLSDPKKSLERMYLELQRVKAKYSLALEILKLLSPEGIPVDRKKYYNAVLAFNNYQSNK